MEFAVDGDTSYSWRTWNNLQKLSKKTGGIGNQKKNKNHTDDIILKISRNIQGSPGDQMKFAVTQTPVKDYKLKLMGKTLKE